MSAVLEDDFLFTENPAVAHIAQSRVEQGLPTTVTDRLVLRRVATLTNSGGEAA
jgi:hypothetical protein